MEKIKFRDYLDCLRPEQWIKNLFIFLPLIFGKKLFNLPADLEIAAAFLLFSFVSSAAYIFNDLADVAQDRLHPAKSLRPIACGKISAGSARILAGFLGFTAVVLSLVLNFYFGCLVLFYLGLNILYTAVLKKMVIIDVFCIAAFFLLRILAGSVIAGIVLSHWIIFMTGLLALFLGFSKRRHELCLPKQCGALTRGVLCNYDIYFIDQLIAVITSSIVIVYLFYAVNARTVQEFGSEHLIYGAPFVYYGIFRYLYIVHRKNKGEDPAQIVLSDLPMQINLLLWLLSCIAVIYLGI